jgi:hypothetical protein
MLRSWAVQEDMVPCLEGMAALARGGFVNQVTALWPYRSLRNAVSSGCKYQGLIRDYAIGPESALPPYRIAAAGRCRYADSPPCPANLIDIGLNLRHFYLSVQGFLVALTTSTMPNTETENRRVACMECRRIKTVSRIISRRFSAPIS